MTPMTQQLEESTQFLKDQGIESGVVGIILGTGLGDLVEHLVIEKEIAFDAIPHFPKENWNPFGDNKNNYYMHLTYRIENGKITEIIP